VDSERLAAAAAAAYCSLAATEFDWEEHMALEEACYDIATCCLIAGVVRGLTKSKVFATPLTTRC
jgi:hypothetical protein